MSEVLLVDRSARLRMTFSGEKAKDALGGLLTNDVVALHAGEGLRAVALTPKGRVIALTRVFDRGDDIVVDADAAAADGFATMIRKFVNPRLAKYAVVTEQMGCLGVYGNGADTLVARVLGVDVASLANLAPMAGRTVGDSGDAVYVVRSTDLSAPGFDLIASRARIAEVALLLRAGDTRDASPEEVRTMRIEAGIPEFGVEMDAETIPQEAVLDDLGAISFDKGCYTGQEVVARIHFRGHVNRQLRWLTSTSLLAVGAKVLDAEGKDVGDVRSSVISPRRGPLAIAMVRREVALGSTVQVAWGASRAEARVERLGTTPPAMLKG